MTWWAVLLLLSQPAAESAGTVACTGTGPATGREFVLERRGSGDTWRLSYRDREHPDWVRLALDGAEPVLGDGTATLRFRNANGGRQVALDVAPGKAKLDVYVDYGLDVNIERDLAPEVDRMNTNGPLTSIDCRVSRANP